ncbi:la-related protein 6C-like isoform X2 [Andrographis paniculata]|uniref:la-related protein 6C-like isoform X2 n=1 Tax=Andrographis paniculata TaxID=175694 RepID=UPI0021E72FBE|nr:la-related protein 6C-like isoform X2 [Andrographis paniculata]
MAQRTDHLDAKDESLTDCCTADSTGSFRFNVSAPEFVPSLVHTPVQVPIAGYFYPCFHYVDGTGTAAGSWMYVTADQETPMPVVQSPSLSPKPAAPVEPAQTSQPFQNPAKEIILTDEIRAKIIKQAEYMFSDMSLLANETLMKHVNKDPEGFVSLNFVSTLKKLKSLNVSNQVVAEALRSSTELVVSNDGKKVRRKQPFTDKEKEELQLRAVIAENLPDDHSHQKIEKMFNVVGRVKAIRICQPQEHSSSRASKGDVVVSNKLHALVEYENPETAEKAAEKLNDERNWRKGMRVRVMLKRPATNKASSNGRTVTIANSLQKPAEPKSAASKNRKSDSEDDKGSTHLLHEDTVHHVNSSETSDADENPPPLLRRSWSRSRDKPKQRAQLKTARSLPTPSTTTAAAAAAATTLNSCPGQPLVKGPRMPDGTRGFTMGRGKPVAIPVQSS